MRCDRERVAEAGLLASTLALLGYVAWWATKALESYTVWGLG